MTAADRNERRYAADVFCSRRYWPAGAAAALAAGAAAQTSADGEPRNAAWKQFFPAGFRNERIKTSGAEINAVIGGSGPPVLMFHGAPRFADHLAPDRARSRQRLHAGDVRSARLRRFEQAARTAAITPAIRSAPWRSTASK